MKYAIVKKQGHQYKVQEGDEILLEGKKPTSGEKVDFGEVLLMVDQAQVKIGKPYVKTVSIDALVLGTQKGRKLRVTKYKAKSRYRKTRGYRAKFVRVKIQKINTTSLDK